jgi:hypothetical protein
MDQALAYIGYGQFGQQSQQNRAKLMKQKNREWTWTRDKVNTS